MGGLFAAWQLLVAAFPALLVAVLKVTLLLSVALLIDRALRGRVTALSRHRFWTMTLILTLALPFVGPLLPSWGVLPSLAAFGAHPPDWSVPAPAEVASSGGKNEGDSVLPGVQAYTIREQATRTTTGGEVTFEVTSRTVTQQERVRHRERQSYRERSARTRGSKSESTATVAVRSSESGTEISISPPESTRQESTSFAVQVDDGGLPTRPADGPDRALEGHAAMNGSEPSVLRRALASGALAIWLLGTMAALGLLAVALRRERGLLHSASPMDAAWHHERDQVARALGLSRAVRLGTHASATTPLTGGLARPVVILPTSADVWTQERRRLVLAHELVHVLRHDSLRQLLSRAVLALYWFHPLIRIAVRRASAAREQACDEAVLALGARPSDYAGHLLALADQASAPSPAAILAMAEPSQLERRLLVILDPNRPLRGGILAACALLAIFLGGVALASAAPAPPRPPAVPVAPFPVAPVPALPAPTTVEAHPAPRTAPAAPTVPERVSGSVSVSPRVPTAPAPIIAPRDGWSHGVPPAPLAIPAPDTPATAPAPPLAPSVPSAVPAFPLQPSAPSTVPALPHLSSGLSPDTDPAPVLAAAGWAPAAPVAMAAAAVAAPHAETDTACVNRSRGTFHGSMWTSNGTPMQMIGVLDGERVFVFQVDDDLRVCARASEDLDFSEGRDLDFRPGSWLDIETIDGRDRHRLRVAVGADRQPQYQWSVDGRSCAFGTTGERWLDAALEAIADWQAIASLRGQEGSLRGKIGSIRGQEGSLNGKIGSIRGRRGSLQGRIGSLQGELGSMRGAIGSLRGQIGSLRGRYHRQGEAERAKSEHRIRQLEARIADQEGDLRRREAEIEREIATIREQMTPYDDDGAEIRAIKAEIAALDSDSRIEEIEAQIVDLDADRRIQQLEDGLPRKVKALKRTVSAGSC